MNVPKPFTPRVPTRSQDHRRHPLPSSLFEIMSQRASRAASTSTDLYAMRGSSHELAVVPYGEPALNVARGRLPLDCCAERVLEYSFEETRHHYANFVIEQLRSMEDYHSPKLFAHSIVETIRAREDANPQMRVATALWALSILAESTEMRFSVTFWTTFFRRCMSITTLRQ
jgi:hypothetical protein